MKGPRYRSPRLVTARDPGYRRFLREQYLGRKARRSHPPQPPSAGTLLGKALEGGVCQLLAGHVALSARTILTVEKRIRQGIYVHRYKEIDAVVLGGGGQPALFVEVKMRSSALRATAAAHSQLQQIRVLSAGAWPDSRLAAVVLLPDEPTVPLDADGVPRTLAVPVAAREDVASLAALDWPVDQVAVVALRRSDVWRSLLERGAVDDPTLLERARAESAASRASRPPVVASTPEPAGGTSALGAALLAALGD